METILNDINESLDSCNHSLMPGNWGLWLQGSSDYQSATAVNAKIYKYRSRRNTSRNVSTLYQQGKMDNVILEMDRMEINCLSVCETWWTKNGPLQNNDKTIICSGRREHQRGVALILNKPFFKSILSHWPEFDWLLLHKLRAGPLNVKLLVANENTS